MPLLNPPRRVLDGPARFRPTASRRGFLVRTGAALALAPLATPSFRSRVEPLRVRVWCEGSAPRSIYPDDIDGAIAQGFQLHAGLQVTTGRLSDPDAGLSEAALDATDVLVWWGRLRHDEVPESRSVAVIERVRAGKLGFLALHTAYGSKPFRGLMGMPCEPRSWHDEGRPEHVQIAAPEHPIARDVRPFVLPRTTMFLEPFVVPDPETVVLLSSWGNGPSFRSGMTWTRELGRVAYLRPGDDAFPVLFHPAVRQLLLNAVDWLGRRT